MPKLTEKNRRESTLVRDREVHAMYKAILTELGELAPYVSKEYVYGRIRERTKLSIRCISFILNHIKVGGVNRLFYILRRHNGLTSRTHKESPNIRFAL